MARPAAVALLAAALALSPATIARASAGWGRPFRLAGPESLDVLAPQIALSPSGLAAVAFDVQNEDHPASSEPYVAWRTGARFAKPRRVSGAQEILALAFDGPTLELLTGTSTAGDPCCGSVQAVSLTAAGSFGRRTTLVGGLAGASSGRLVALAGGRMLAAIASASGVWVAQTVPGSGFGSTHRLTAADASPETLAAAPSAAGGSIAAWTQTTDPSGEVAPRSVLVAEGSPSRAPAGRRAALTVAQGHGIDELGLVADSAVPTVAWIESWYDELGLYHSQAVVANLTRGARARPLPVPGQFASALSLAGDASTERVLAWKSCTSAGTCTVRAAFRSAGKRFGPAALLGSIDPSEAPAASVLPDGEALVGWINGGHVLVSRRGARSGRFGAADTVSRTNFATDLALASGPGEAIAAWTQATLEPIVVGAMYR